MNSFFYSKTFMYIVIVYFCLISLYAAIITIADKIFAVKRMRRISEKALMLTSVLGGSIAMLMTMNIIRHKTRHIKFMAGIPAIIILQAVAVFYILKRFYL